MMSQHDAYDGPAAHITTGHRLHVMLLALAGFFVFVVTQLHHREAPVALGER